MKEDADDERMEILGPREETEEEFLRSAQGFLLSLNVNRYFIHVMYTFVLFAAIIWLSLLTENTMAKVEENKEVLEELEIENAQLTYEAAKAERRTTVELRLEELGSQVTEPEKPATRLP